MSPFLNTIIFAVLEVAEVVMGVLGLIWSIQGKGRGVPGLMVGAFVFIIIAAAGGLIWQFVSMTASSWQLSYTAINVIYLVVELPLNIAELLALVLVAIAVRKLYLAPERRVRAVRHSRRLPGTRTARR